MHELQRRVRLDGNPLIDGKRVTWVWEGETAPYLVGDFNNWEDHTALLQPVANGLWSYSTELPLDAYIEYAFRAYPNAHERLPDPYNARRTPNGMGYHNYFFYMPQGRPSPLARRRRSGRGQLLERELRDTVLMATPRRTVWLYQPQVEEACPLLIVLDGKDYLRRANLPAIIENLSAPGKMRPLALALVDSGGPARGVEYLCSEATVGLLLQQVLPMAQAELNLLPPESGTYGILGASLGGLMALYAGLRAPNIFGRVLSQSGAFLFPGYRPPVFEMVERRQAAHLQAWLQVGRYEGLLDANQEMRNALIQHGYALGYHEYNAGHNYPAWRDNLHHGLMALYPGKPLLSR